MEFLFKNLIVWQKSMELTKLVYDLSNRFPVEERYALSDQLRRAVSSVPSNIAEGNGRSSNRDYAHFLAIARGSLYEMITQLEIAKSLHYIENYDGIESVAEEVSRMLTSMLRKFGAIQNHADGLEGNDHNCPPPPSFST